jgi:WD40 repeat protein
VRAAMIAADPPRIRVFISSPADVATERDLAEHVVARLGGIWKAHVHIESVRWERAHYDAAKSFQEQVGEMAQFDLVCGILWKRLGQPLPPDLFHRPDGSGYESGTVFELETAIACGGKPRVYLFRKIAPVLFAAESVEQDKQQHDALLDWWKKTVRDPQGYFRRGYQEFATPAEFEAKLESVLEDYLRAEGLVPSGPAWDIDKKGSPYPGLVPYDDAYSTVFFGRGLAHAETLREIRAAAGRELPALFIVGPSGSGKSSLVRAGMMPAFGGTQIPGVDAWRTALLEPAQAPLDALAECLYRKDVLPELAGSPQPAPRQFVDVARQSPQAAAHAVKWALDRAADAERRRTRAQAPVVRLLLVLDQLETVLDSADCRALAALARALVEDGSTWLIASLRSDRYPDLQLDPDFLHLRRGNALFDLPPPGASEIADIIAGPARAAGLVFEERAGKSLAKTIEAAVGGADALPLLQMTLSQLFNARDRNTLTYAAYEAMGGLEGAIAARAEEVFRSASPAAQGALDVVLRSLVADMDENGQLTIRTPDRSAFASNVATSELVDRMTEARLLVSADTGVRVAHEALLRRWQRAMASPALRPEAIRLRRQIGPNFDVWRKTRLEGDLLQAGTALAQANAIVREHPGAFPPELEDYVRRSADAVAARIVAEEKRAAVDARRARWLMRAAVIIALAFMGLSALIYAFYNRAQESERETRHQAAAATYRTALQQQQQGFDEGALAYFAKAVRLEPANSAISTALLMLLSNRYWPTLSKPDLAHARTVNSAHFSPDGRRVITASADGTAMIWDARTGAPLTPPLRHDDVVFGAQFSPDGTRVVTWSNDNTAQVWDAQTGERVGKALKHRGWITSAAFSPDGKLVVTGSFDCSAQIWNAQSGEHVGGPLPHLGWIDSVAFSADASRIVTAADTKARADSETCPTVPAAVPENAAQIWSAASGERLGNPMQHGSGVRTAYFSSDGMRVVTASNDGTARLWDGRTGAAIGEPMVHQARTYTAEFDAAGRRVVTASTDKTARVWDGISGKPLTPPLVHAREVKSAKFSPDGKRVLTASEDMTAQVWDAATGKPIGAPLRHHGVVLSAEYSLDGAAIVTASDDHSGRIWDARTGAPRPQLLEHAGPVRGAWFSPDGVRVVTVSKDGTAALWDAQSGNRVGKRLHHAGPVNTADFDHAGTRVVTASEDGTARIWNAITGEPIGVPLRHEAPVNGAWFNPQGTRILTVTANGFGFIWDAASGEKVGKPLRHTDAIRNAAFSPDGLRIATAPNDHAARIWDAGTGEAIGHVLQHDKAVHTVRFSSDGKWIVTASDDQTARVWDASTGASRGAPLQHQGPVYDAEFSRHGKWVVTASKDGNARVWDVESGTLVGAVMRHDAPVATAFLSDDGKLALTASADGTARLWDAATGQYFGMLLAHGGPVNSARFSPDGRHVVTASDDASARLWRIAQVVPPVRPALAAELAEAVGRLTVGPLGDLLPLADAPAVAQKLRAHAPAANGSSDLDAIVRELSAPD